MENFQEANNHDDLPGSPRGPLESTNLVSQNSKPNYLNVVSNVCSLVFFVVLIYFSFDRGVSLFSFHPLFMGVAWILLFPSGINSITPGDVATEWMPARLRSKRHWIVQLSSLIFSLMGLAVIVTHKIIDNGSHFVSLHAIFGLVAIILMVSASWGGVGALYSLKLKDYVAPIYIKIIHSFAGIITFSFAMASIIVILFSGWFRFGEAVRIAYGDVVLPQYNLSHKAMPNTTQIDLPSSPGILVEEEDRETDVGRRITNVSYFFNHLQSISDRG